MTARRRAALVVGLGLVLVAAGCGGGMADDRFVGTWLRSDDSGFVLTISRPSGGGYELLFENRANGESQIVAGMVRPNDTLQAAFELPPEATDALVPGPPDVVAITLRVEDGVLVVRADGAAGVQTVLWRYERAEE